MRLAFSYSTKAFGYPFSSVQSLSVSSGACRTAVIEQLELGMIQSSMVRLPAERQGVEVPTEASLDG